MYEPFELLQRAGVGVGVGRQRGRQLIGLQAVGEGVEVFDEQPHHQHVLLCGAERLLKEEPVTTGTNTQPVTFQSQRADRCHASQEPKAANHSPRAQGLSHWSTEATPPPGPSGFEGPSRLPSAGGLQY